MFLIWIDKQTINKRLFPLPLEESQWCHPPSVVSCHKEPGDTMWSFPCCSHAVIFVIPKTSSFTTKLQMISWKLDKSWLLQNDSVDLRQNARHPNIVTPVRKWKSSPEKISECCAQNAAIKLCQWRNAIKRTQMPPCFLRWQKLYCKEQKLAAHPKTQLKVHVL